MEGGRNTRSVLFRVYLLHRPLSTISFPPFWKTNCPTFRQNLLPQRFDASSQNQGIPSRTKSQPCLHLVAMPPPGITPHFFRILRCPMRWCDDRHFEPAPLMPPAPEPQLINNSSLYSTNVHQNRQLVFLTSRTWLRGDSPSASSYLDRPLQPAAASNAMPVATRISSPSSSLLRCAFYFAAGW